MKFKYPKKIIVGAVEFKIIYAYKESGASFSYPDGDTKGFVKFGMAEHKANPLMFLNLIIHEFKEIINVEQGARFFARSDDAYQFHYEHKQHMDLCSRLAGIINQFVK